ncbi:Hepatocyte growth factor receptor, partial [Geodia barretti]
TETLRDPDNHYGFGTDNGGGGTAELLLYLQQRFGPVTSFSGSYRADRWELNINRTSDEKRGCENGDVRLQGGASPYNGYVEFCCDRVWGGVCSDGWDANDTRVVCRHLGFDAGDGVLIDAPPDAAENALAFLDPITCTGSDRYVNECSHNVLSTAGECTKIAVSCRKFSTAVGASSPKRGSLLTWAVIGVAVFTLLVAFVAVIVPLLVVMSSKRHRRKQLERMQLDIMAVAGLNVPNLESTHRTQSMVENEPDEKEAPDEAGANNPYCEPWPASESTTFSHISWTRVPSYRLRELARGKFLVKSGDITLLECIGEGEFGIVYKARLQLSKAVVAVKTFKGDVDQVEVDKFLEESLKMSRFSHAHVMSLTGVCLEAGYIIMPYMANGSLLTYLRRERKNLVLHESDEDEVVEVRKRLMVMCSQIASGMQYLAANKYIHRDLAARNCMIDAHFLIKISDFGLTEDVFERNYYRQGKSHGERVKLPVK